MSENVNFLKPLVASILEKPERLNWSLQGFGMLRTYIGEGNRYRLNIWHSQLAVFSVSTIHDHPWHFTSQIVAGVFVNVRYDIGPIHAPATHAFRTIKTGPNGGMDFNEPATPISLVARRPEIYLPGDIYSQRASEIHESIPVDGTVTINDRTRVGDGERARVFWPIDESWIDAKPRPATVAEICAVAQYALERWF